MVNAWLKVLNLALLGGTLAYHVLFIIIFLSSVISICVSASVPPRVRSICIGM